MRNFLVVVAWMALAGVGLADDGFEARRAMALSGFTNRPLPAVASPGTWVDSERWCVAHACLEAGVRLGEANRYFETVEPVSMWRRLVADTDIQFTDLLWTYVRFRDSARLSDAARVHLLSLFRAWRVPNPDRNRAADSLYEWPAEYTENHSLNILASAYFIDVVLGRDPAPRAALLRAFLADRAGWGWSEFHSPSYALVTVKVLGMLASAAPDADLAMAARMHLDILALDFAQVGLRYWRGMPHARGYGSEGSNAGNSMCDVARLWFADSGGAPRGGSPFLVHLVTDGYRPPEAAERLLREPEARGRYELRKTVTHGPGKLRIPIVGWVTPAATMASAQGSGSYYDGCYCSISFASAPEAVITARDGKGRTIFQRRNVLATFGTVTWHGPMKPKRDGRVQIGGDASAWAGQVDLATNCHVLMVAEKRDYPDAASFRRALDALEARFEDGVVRWTAPDGAVVEMLNERAGDGWRMTGARENGRLVRLDSNMLFDSPNVRSVRDSGAVEVIADDKSRLVYDFRSAAGPVVRAYPGGSLPPLPSERMDGPLGIRMVLIPGGEFPMGSGIAEGRRDERPERWVSVSAFYVSETEITVGQYRQYLAANPGVKAPPDWYGAEWGKSDAFPMTWVSWDDAQGFCRWLSSVAKRAYRLPTEAEWEKAAKGYAQRLYPWGDSYDGTQSGTKNGVYAPAGEHQLDVSPFGVRGMAGNAWEWCSDWYAADAYATAPPANPTGPARGTQRVLRGCGWNFDPDTFRCAYRSRLEPGERAVHIGFRVACEVE